MKDKSLRKEIILDARGLECPIPVLKARKLAQTSKNGDKIKVICTDPLAEMDFKHYCEQSKFKYINCVKKNNEIIIFYQIIKSK
tara:strand:+ start:239 stop:490 length:252 start_codon:yes stop_codon:yes gene_type:complete